MCLASPRTQPWGRGQQEHRSWQHSIARAGHHSWLKQQPLLAWEEQITPPGWGLLSPLLLSADTLLLSRGPQLQTSARKWEEKMVV